MLRIREDQMAHLAARTKQRFVSMLERMGAATPQIGDSTGAIRGLDG